jgi:hypothetical protein
MTEPLLLATTTVAVAMLMQWCRADLKVCTTNDRRAGPHAFRDHDRSAGLQACRNHERSASLRAGRDQGIALQACHVGWVFALACLTRYEAWPVTASALAAAAWTRWRRGLPLTSALREVAAIAVYLLRDCGILRVQPRRYWRVVRVVRVFRAGEQGAERSD